MVDLFLAIATLVIQFPPIHNSRAYVYLTVFQVLRIYRPIIYVERLRSLIVSFDVTAGIVPAIELLIATFVFIENVHCE